MEVYREGDEIYFKDTELDILGRTNYTDDLFKIVSSVNWSVNKTDGMPRYLYSSRLKKYLHQVVIDYYFGEEVRKAAYKSGMIVEHLNNNGFDCRISNVYFLLDVKNKYKGMYFDKLAAKSIPIVSLKIFHIFENHTFQIVICFNRFFVNKDGECIHIMKLLYEYDYELVLQDAEKLLEILTSVDTFNLDKLRHMLRYKAMKIIHAPDIEPTEEESKLPSGSIIFRDGEPFIIQRNDGYGHLHFIESPYDKDWT